MKTYSSLELFTEALYDEQSNTIPDFLKLYHTLLMQRADENSILHANRIKQYRREIADRRYLNELRKNFNSLYSLIDTEYPDLKFIIDGRIKSVVSTERKIVKNINEAKSLDLLRDTTAFRVMLFGQYEPEKLVELCYLVMNSIIKHTISNYTLCEAESVRNTLDLEKDDHSGIIIPSKSGINPRYQYGVKDYILTPKKNKYQSLHATFRRQKGGECFEVQVRTFDMHILAETGEASHAKYKQKKYYCRYEFDREKIHIPGYSVANGTVYDFIGLEKSLQILKRQKLF